jgi:magnesium chelatase subunit I
VQQIPGLREALEQLGPSESPGLTAAAIEFVLEGLHLHQKLNKDRDGGRWAFRA